MPACIPFHYAQILCERYPRCLSGAPPIPPSSAPSHHLSTGYQFLYTRRRDRHWGGRAKISREQPSVGEARLPSARTP